MSPTDQSSDGHGLWLHRRENHRAQWFLRAVVHGRRREMGLGAFPSVSLEDARAVAEKWQAVARQRLDPTRERERRKREALGRRRRYRINVRSAPTTEHARRSLIPCISTRIATA